MKFPKVSIIMSVYNGSDYIEETLRSIFEQEYKNFELIIIDDASTDNTVEIINKFQDKRVILKINNENKRLAYNLNVAISLAEGEYIARIDADDICSMDRLTKQVNLLEENSNLLIVGGYAKQFGDSHKLMKYPLIHEEIKTALLFENCLCHPAVMYRNKPEVIQYDPEFKASQDYELWTRLIWSEEFANISDIVLNYRVHKKQTKFVLHKEQNSGARYARLFMLRKVYAEATEDEKELFLLSCNTHIPKTAEQMRELALLYNNIFNSNSKCSVFDSNILKKYMERQYFKNYYVSLHDNFVSLKTLLEFVGPSYIASNFGLFVKAYLFYLKQLLKSR